MLSSTFHTNDALLKTNSLFLLTSQYDRLEFSTFTEKKSLKCIMPISFETKNILIAVQRNIVAKCKLTFRHIELLQEVLVAKRTQGLSLSAIIAFYWKSDIVEIV